MILLVLVMMDFLGNKKMEEIKMKRLLSKFLVVLALANGLNFVHVKEAKAANVPGTSVTEGQLIGAVVGTVVGVAIITIIAVKAFKWYRGRGYSPKAAIKNVQAKLQS